MTPQYLVLADGIDITAIIMTRMMSLSVTDQAGVESDTFDLLLDDEDDLIDPPRKGAKLKIFMGYRETGLAYMGEFTVDEVDVGLIPRDLRISGKAADMRAAMKSQKTREFGDKPTLKIVYGKIAADHGLELKIAPELSSKSIEYLAQTEESDMNLATRLARRFDAVAKIADGKMIVTKRGSASSASGKAMATITVSYSDIKKGRGKLKDRERFGAVKANWHDQAKAKKTEVQEKQGEGPVYTLRETFPTEAEAREACKAKLQEMQRREADISLELPGNTAIVAEAKLILTDVSRKLDGEYVIKRARHTFKGSKPGYTTQVEAEPPGRRKDAKDGKK